MEEKKKGYVYILTNPSFKEDWVKIGKTSKTVEQRVRDLDGTAVPLPFEIYATLRTSKYEEVEKAVHDTIDSLTDLRIRQKREFFNITPHEALNILKRFSTMLDDAEIKEYKREEPIDNNVKVEKLQPRHAKRKEFWGEFIQYCRDNDGIYSTNTPVGDNWIGKSIKVPYGIGMNAVIGYDFARVEIYFNSGDKNLNKSVFDYLFSKREVIEQEYGSSLIWERLSDKTTCRVKEEKECHPFDMEDKTEVFEFLKSASDRMSVIFHNHILDYKKEN